MIASIRGKKPHVYLVIILKQMADHIWEVMPHTSLSLTASSRYPPNSQVSAGFCNLAKNSRIDWPSTSLHLWNLYLSAMSNGFGVKFRPITSTISVNDNSVGLVGVAVRLFNKAYQSVRANWLPFSRWEHCSLRKTGFQTLYICRPLFHFRAEITCIGALNDAALAPWTSTPALLSPPDMLL